MTESTEGVPPPKGQGALRKQWIVVLVGSMVVSAVALSIALRPVADEEFTSVYENYEFPLVAANRTAPCVGDPCGFGGTAIAVADLDADGEREIVAVGGGQPSGEVGSAQFVTVWHFTRDGELVLLSGAWNSSFSYEARSLLLVDLDGNGYMEIVTGGLANWFGRNAAYLSVWEWSEGSLTRLAHERWTWSGSDTQLTDLVAGDLDGDGQIEILAVAYGEPTSGPRVGQVTVWNYSAGLDALRQEAEASFYGTQGDVMPFAASLVGPSVLMAGRSVDDANGTVSGFLTVLSYSGTSVRSLAERFVPDVDFRVLSEGEPVGPDAFRLLAGGYHYPEDTFQRTILHEISVNASDISEGPQMDYRVRSRPDVYMGFRGMALSGDVAIATGWAGVGPAYAFVQVLTRTAGSWMTGALSEWAYILNVANTRQETSHVFGVSLVDLETSSAAPEILSVGAAEGALELRVWRMPS